MKSLFDKVEQLCVAVAIHPFMWGLELDKDHRDKSLAITVGPITIGLNW